MTTIWSSGNVTPAATHRIPVDISTVGGASHVTIGDLQINNKITTSGLAITIEAFAIIDASGLAVDIATDTITATASSTHYLVLDLATLDLKLLDRQYHNGCLILSEVVTDGSSVTSIENLFSREAPKSRIHRTLNRLANSRNAGDVRIAIVGDSLLEPAGTGTGWDDLLFNATYVADGYNVPNLGNITVDNFAVGGSTSHYSSILAGESHYMAAGGANWQDTVMAFANNENSRRFFPPKSDVGVSPLLTDPYDLIIIGMGSNSGTLDLMLQENLIVNLRKAGSEVIIVTQNYRTDNATFLETRGDDLKKIADATGSALVDTWMYVLEDDRSGLTVHSDVIHMAADGHKAWAKALSGVLNPALELESEKIADVSYVIGLDSGDAREWDMHPNYSSIQFSPYDTDGTVDQTTTATVANKNPAILFGGKTSSTAVTTVANTKFASFGHPWATSFDLLVDGSSDFTADIKIQSQGSTIGTATLSGGTSGRAEIVEGVGATTYSDIAAEFRRNRSIQIVVTSGTMKIIGVIFRCDKITELDIDADVKTNGTFSSEVWAYANPHSVYSDTDLDSISFDYFGSDAVVYLSQRSAAGKVDIYLDGKIIYTALDLYTTGTFLKPIHIPATPDFDYHKNRPAKHSVQVRLNGTNASVIPPVASNRRLGLVAVHVFDKT